MISRRKMLRFKKNLAKVNVEYTKLQVTLNKEKKAKKENGEERILD